jgi:hypothetical protein
MLGTAGYDVIDVGAKRKLLSWTITANLHLDGKERRVFDVHVDHLGWGHQKGATVHILAQHPGEQPYEFRPPDRAIAIEPSAVP